MKERRRSGLPNPRTASAKSKASSETVLHNEKTDDVCPLVERFLRTEKINRITSSSVVLKVSS